MSGQNRQRRSLGFLSIPVCRSFIYDCMPVASVHQAFFEASRAVVRRPTSWWASDERNARSVRELLYDVFGDLPATGDVVDSNVRNRLTFPFEIAVDRDDRDLRMDHFIRHRESRA